MSKERLELILQMLDIKKNQWFGEASAAGSLCTVTSELALWKPQGMKHCTWELALHIAYGSTPSAKCWRMIQRADSQECPPTGR